MSETQHGAQTVEQFQSALKLYRRERQTVKEAIEVRDGYKNICQGEEELNNIEHQPLFDAAIAENMLRDNFRQAKEESTKLVQEYMDEGKYKDAIVIINQIIEAEAAIGGAGNASVSQTTEYKEKVSPISVDTRSRKVFRGAEEHSISPLLYRILLYLMENPGRVVLKKELFDAGWPGAQYDGRASNLRIDQCISRLRKVIGEENLESMHGHGVIFHCSQILS